jgi:hypothetical protein
LKKSIVGIITFVQYCRTSSEFIGKRVWVEMKNKSGMLSGTRVVSDLIVGSSPYGRKSVDTTTHRV